MPIVWEPPTNKNQNKGGLNSKPNLTHILAVK